MLYVTQGTVQVKRKTETDADVCINPIPDYAVKHNGKEFIVFVEADAQSSQPQSKVLEKTKAFAVEKYLVEMLTKAAFKGTKIEITMNADCKIEALKIPAMP
jgi:hypothetical protein